MHSFIGVSNIRCANIHISNETFIKKLRQFDQYRQVACQVYTKAWNSHIPDPALLTRVVQGYLFQSETQNKVMLIKTSWSPLYMLLIVKQILFVRTKRNEWKTVWRICMTVWRICMIVFRWKVLDGLPKLFG